MFGLLSDLMDYYRIKKTKRTVNPPKSTEDQSLSVEGAFDGTELSGELRELACQLGLQEYLCDPVKSLRNPLLNGVFLIKLLEKLECCEVPGLISVPLTVHIAQENIERGLQVLQRRSASTASKYLQLTSKLNEQLLWRMYSDIVKLYTDKKVSPDLPYTPSQIKSLESALLN